MGGFITPPKEYFPIVADIVKKYGGVFISDEVQTGWGRTGGKWFGIEQWGVQPDIITSAKGLANGAPIGLTIARPEIADSVKGATISTFGGNPIATTAAKAVIDFIEDHKLSINAAEVGAYLRDKLLELQAKHPLIGDVRGMGLLQAIELVEDRETKKPAACANRGVDGSRARERHSDRQGRILRQRAAHFAAAEYRKSDVDEFARLLDRKLRESVEALRRGIRIIIMDERAFYKESQTTKPITLQLSVLPHRGDLRSALAGAHQGGPAARQCRRTRPRQVQKGRQLHGPAGRQGDVQEHALPETF